MTKYVWKRLLLLIPTILGVMFIVYTILSLTPGTPGKLILGQSATPEAINQLNEELGFNNPFLVRFFDYIVDALHGDFGVSYNTQRPVFDEIFPRFPTTVIIAFLSVCLLYTSNPELNLLYVGIHDEETAAEGIFQSVGLFKIGRASCRERV